MKPYYEQDGVRILNGDCRTVLASMDAGSVDCCVTSPPYFGLRDYGHADQIGLEPTPDAYVAEMVGVFREVRRVLADDGTVWLNLGDSYTGSANAGGEASRTCNSAPNAVDRNLPNKRGAGLKSKDLIGIPWRVAFALQADGWYLRQDIIWHKPNPMPESVTDRCTKAHEYLFLLSKSERYYYDAEAIAEDAIHAGETIKNNAGKNGQMGDYGQTRGGFLRPEGVTVKDTRNRRSVWSICSQPYSGAHFATMPPDLVKPCVLAGCPDGGVVLDPFSGSGTTAFVARDNGRRAVGIELNETYCALAAKRLAQGVLAFP